MKALILPLIAMLVSFAANSATIYVNINATGANSGANWTDAFTDLQDAIALSTFGDDIWVAQGTYKTTSGTNQNIYFNIKNGTKLYGGFDGTETLLTERDIAANVTILSGEIGSGSATDNSNNVVRFNNVTNQTRLDGFTITAGYNNSGYGGGARVIASSPIIANCIFLGNHAGEGGGAINHNTSGILTLEGCTFDGNVGNTYGGGALRLYTGTVNISDCYFKSNQSNTYGGAIYISGAIVNITNSVIAGNIAQTTGSAIRIFDTGTLHMSNSLVVGNYTNQTSTISSSTFSNNNQHTITNCTIAHNKHDNSTQSSTSSAVALNNDATITNSIIYGNISLNQVLNTGLTFSNSISEASQNGSPGFNILYVDPQFEAPGDASTAPFDTTGVNYQLNLLSQGVDAGESSTTVGSTDLAGNPRIQNASVDMGAYEKAFCASSSQFTNQPPYTICSGDPIVFYVDNGVNHVWNYNYSITQDSLVVSSPTTVNVIFEDINGCRGELSANVTANSNPIPNINFASGNLYTGNGYSTYQWYFNGAPIAGANAYEHVPIQGYGLYSVEVQSNSGCDGSNDYCLSPAALTASGPTEFCDGGDVTLTVTDGDSYVWSTGSLNSSITVSTSDNYTVTVFNAAAGCSVELEQDVVVYPSPNPSINFNGQDLSTSAFSTYQWNFNGTPIVGATSQNLDPVPTGNGQYTVTVTNSNGCETTSSVYNLTDLSIVDQELVWVNFHPNPVSSASQLTVALSDIFQQESQFELYNAVGQKVFETSMSGSEVLIDLPELETGIYFVTIKNSVHSISGLKVKIR